MDEITLKNYRCFREEQVARMAPLTLLVGENSTGKTSFLAMIRILWDIAGGRRMPDFKESPYDLGSFDEVAHHRGGRGGRARSFEAGFSIRRAQEHFSQPYWQKVVFGKEGTVPVPISRSFSYGNIRVDMKTEGGIGRAYIENLHGKWEREIASHDSHPGQYFPHEDIITTFYPREGEEKLNPVSGISSALEIGRDEFFQEFIVPISVQFNQDMFLQEPQNRPFSSAPVRSKPHRTYDPTSIEPDYEGDYIPMYLANVFFRQKKIWDALKRRIEEFGHNSGMFDEITIKKLGRGDGDPFQVQIRKFGKSAKGSRHNLIDVGYGVSQALPVVTELLRPDGPRMFLMQQPEVHLHPSAQAALGSLFCTAAATDRQIVVETHSDHLLDRVRMDVRDRKTKLKPEDVSILYFERTGLDVTIHSIRIDDQGNIIDAPNSYRQFFMEETSRSLGL